MPRRAPNVLVERLRNVRKQQRLSLQAVEAASNAEFKASVLGAYERGERAISVPRLQRLARFYNVPVDQLLPRYSAIELSWNTDLAGEEPADADVDKITKLVPTTLNIKLKDAIEHLGPLPVSQGVLNYTPEDHFGFTPDSYVMLKVVNGEFKLDAK